MVEINCKLCIVLPAYITQSFNALSFNEACIFLMSQHLTIPLYLTRLLSWVLASILKLGAQNWQL